MKRLFLLMLILFFAMNASPALAITISPTIDAMTLTNNILGGGITVVGSPTYVGVQNQSGTFTGGNASGVGFENGIVLTTGNVNQIPGPNSSFVETRSSNSTGGADDISTILGTSGDSDLTALSGFPTFDAAVLEFKFQFDDGSVGGDLYFNFVFASEEYLNFVDSPFNDVFGFFVDGVNIGVIPGTSTPITVNNVNDLTNSSYYRNNVNNTNGVPVLDLDLRFDGLTTVIQAQMLGLEPGVHSMKFAIADASDGRLDAGVFIQGGTFTTIPTPIPEPGTILLLAAGLIGLAGASRKKLKK